MTKTKPKKDEVICYDICYECKKQGYFKNKCPIEDVIIIKEFKATWDGLNELETKE